ncbi:hypothetical protein, partial [Burkholderia ubonensis]|uniref:hypothetical protein n=1 Tax=Burkholderia ubonensis TaxID=101571 RepID=UPI001E583312
LYACWFIASYPYTIGRTQPIPMSGIVGGNAHHHRSTYVKSRLNFVKWGTLEQGNRMKGRYQPSN